MSLIKCPECNKEISDKSEVCIHCGFPIKAQSELLKPHTCNINGKIIDFSNVYNAIPISRDDYLKLDIYDQFKYSKQVVQNIQSTISINSLAANYLAEQILETGEIPKEFDAIKYEAQDNQNKIDRQNIMQIHCPRCGSTSITTGARGVNWTLGLIGASKTVNRCAKCGHTWQPHL